MEINRDITPGQFAKLTVEVPSEEVTDEFLNVLKSFQKNAKVPGFRPGKIPLSLVRNQYGKELLLEKAEELSKKYIGDVLKDEEELKPAGPLSLNLLEYGEGKSLKFEVSFPLQPVVTLTKYKGLKMAFNDAEITPADIDREIEAQRRKMAVMQSIETPAPAEAKLEITKIEVDPSGLQLIGRKEESEAFEFGLDQLGLGTDEQLLGIQAGEKRIIRVPQDDRLTKSASESLIMTPAEVLHDRQGEASDLFYSVEAVRVEVLSLPEVDDDFAQKVDGSLKTVEDLRKWMEINLVGLVSYTRRHHLENQLVSLLIEANPFPIHESVIDMFLYESATERNLKDEDLREFFSENRTGVAQQYRWVLLRDALAEQEGLKVTKEEIETEIQSVVEQTHRPVEEIQKIYEQQEHRDRLENRIFERKIINYLIENADLEERKLSLEEFFQSFSDSEE